MRERVVKGNGKNGEGIKRERVVETEERVGVVRGNEGRRERQLRGTMVQGKKEA